MQPVIRRSEQVVASMRERLGVEQPDWCGVDLICFGGAAQERNRRQDFDQPPCEDPDSRLSGGRVWEHWRGIMRDSHHAEVCSCRIR